MPIVTRAGTLESKGAQSLICEIIGMAQQTSSTPDYTMGFSEGMLQFLRRHTLEANSAYLIPYLRPGLRVLDFGCGPGTISVGLARAVAPGEMHGVDMEQSQIELARSVAHAAGQDNATFHVADAIAMPFEDDYFDIAHCYNVLMHIPDTAAVLAEVKRVLRPGGFLGCRELICDSCFSRPDFGCLQRAWALFGDLLATDDGHPQMGKDLKSHLVEAGLVDVRASASFNVYSSEEEIKHFDSLASNWFFSPEVTEAAIKYGAATREMCDEMHRAHNRWKEHPGAVIGIAYGYAVATKPHNATQKVPP